MYTVWRSRLVKSVTYIGSIKMNTIGLAGLVKTVTYVRSI